MDSIMGSPGLGDRRPMTGMLQLTVLMPCLQPRRLSEEDVAHIGTSWTLSKGPAEHGHSDDSLREDELDEDSCEDLLASFEEQMAKNDVCGICLDPFQAGDRLTALPCATDGCPSVWHTDCIREWLCQGHATACPLCRGQVQAPGADSETGRQPTLALEVRTAVPLHGSGNAARHITADVIPELLLLAVLSMSEPSLQGNRPGGGVTSMVSAEVLPGQISHSSGGATMNMTTVTPRSPSWLTLLNGSQRSAFDLPSAPTSAGERGRGSWCDPLNWLTSSAHRRHGSMDGSSASSSSTSPGFGRIFRGGSAATRGSSSDIRAGRGAWHAAESSSIPGADTEGSSQSSTARSSDVVLPLPPMFGISPVAAFQDGPGGPNVQELLLPLHGDGRCSWRSRLVAQGRRSMSRVSGAVRRQRASSVST